MKNILFWLLSGFAACAQTAISPPVVGSFHDSAGSLQRVIGVAGNFVLAGVGISNVLSASFSASAGLVKTDTEVLVLDANAQLTGRFEVAAGPALFAFDAGGAPALAFISGTLFQFAGSSLIPLKWTGNAIAIASDGPESAAVIARAGRRLVRLQVSLVTGIVESQTSLSDLHRPVLLSSSGNLVFTRENAIVVRDTAGAERFVSTSLQVEFFETMGPEWVAVREKSSSRHFALHIGIQNLDLYQLPEVTP